MESLQHIKETDNKVYEALNKISSECRVSLNGNTLYAGRMTDGVFESLISNKNTEKILVEYFIADCDIVMTLTDNKAIDEAIEEYKKYVEDGNASSWNKLTFLESKLPYLPNIDHNNFGTTKWLTEHQGSINEEGDDNGQSMDAGNNGGQDMQTADTDVDMNDADTNEDPDNALGQEGAKEDEENELKRNVKFTIWTSLDEKTTSLKKGEKYLKIEYVYKDKEKGIVIDFLIGKDMKYKKWSLFAGKSGAVSYDDDPIKDLKANNLKDAILNAIEEVVKFIKDVEDDKDEWVQFYINI